MLFGYSIGEMLGFAAIVFAALIVDLYAHKADKPISMRDAALWSVFWILLSLGFALYVGETHGRDQGALFLAGYLLEKSLSVDNLFVFMAIFASFSIRDEFQHRVLYYGIIGALVLRVIFVAIGTSLLLFGTAALVGFGLFVLWSAWKMWTQSRLEHEEIVDYSRHWSVRLATKCFPVHPRIDNHNFFTRQDGTLRCTPLVLCLVVIEIADVMFAFDSVPAVIAVTREPFLVYTSNIFAILGLRSLYFLLAAARRFLEHLEKAVIAILAFIGIKMLLDAFGILHIDPMLSLAVVGGLLALGVIASVALPGDRNGKAGSDNLKDS
jgi:tellurite resistance protein TerC